MARKRDMIQIQTEVISQEEWDQEIGRPGLTVVDVYPDWCGPCASMVGTLKKIKFELGDDMLNYVVARSDDIAALETFRNRSEPLWLFFGSGQLVYQLRGAHAPLLARKIVEELEKEKKVMAGGAERSVISLVCDAPAAIPVAVESAAAAADEAETAEALNARRMRSELRVRRALAPYCVLVVGAAAADRRDEILPLLESHGFTVDLEATKTLTEEEVDELVMPPPPPPAPAPAPAAVASAENASEAESNPADGEGDTPPEDGDAEGAEPKAEAEGGEEGGAGGEEGGGEKEEKEEVEEDPEVVAEREAAKEKLLEGECALLALKDSEFSESSPYRWLTLYLGHAPAPPPGAGGEAAVPPPADRGQDGGDEPPADDGDAAEAEPEAEPEEAPEAEEGEKEPPLSVQLRDILVEAAAAVFTPSTVAGQWAALRRHFPQLHRAPEPSASATAAAAAEQPPQQRQVALVVLTGEDAAEKLAEAGFSVLHSGEGQLTEEVAGELVARLEGGESQIPALVATPVLAAAVASDGGAPLAAIANLDPLYLSDSPEQADKDAQLVFSSWGAEIGSLLAPADGADGAANAAEDGIEGAASAAEDGIDGAADGAEDGAEAAAAEGEEDTATGESAAPEDAPAEDAPATEDTPPEDAPAEETPAEEPANEEAATE